MEQAPGVEEEEEEVTDLGIAYVSLHCAGLCVWCLFFILLIWFIALYFKYESNFNFLEKAPIDSHTICIVTDIKYV